MHVTINHTKQHHISIQTKRQHTHPIPHTHTLKVQEKVLVDSSAVTMHVEDKHHPGNLATMHDIAVLEGEDAAGAIKAQGA